MLLISLSLLRSRLSRYYNYSPPFLRARTHLPTCLSHQMDTTKQAIEETQKYWQSDERQQLTKKALDAAGDVSQKGVSVTYC